MADEDKFAPGFEFGLRPGGKPAAEPTPGAEFAVKPPTAEVPVRERPLPPSGGMVLPGQEMRAGEAGFRAPAIPVGFMAPEPPSRADARALAEGGLGGVGEFFGARLGGPRGAWLGAGVGGYAGSLISELFDPSDKPFESAAQASAIEAAGSATASLVVGGIRRMIGKPNEAAEWLIAQAEKEGRLPPAGAIFSDSTLIQNAQSIAQADIAFGRRVGESLRKSEIGMTNELRQYLHSYIRVKGEASRGFSRYDTLVKNTLGSTGVVSITDDMFRAAEPLLSSWKRLELTGELKIPLVDKITEGLRRIDSPGVAKFETPKLSLQEIQALEDRFRNAAVEMRRGRVGEKQELGGIQFAQAYENIGRKALKLMDEAIDVQIRKGQLPLEARVSLEGARKLWKQWKSGELMLDKIADKMKMAGLEDGPLTSGSVFGAIGEIVGDVKSKAVSQKQIEYLAAIGRAIRQSEVVQTGKAFTWVVRAGQLGLVMNQASVFGGGPGSNDLAGSGAFIAVVPAALAWLTTDKRAVGWLLRGMKVEPGTELAVRLGRQLLTAMAREGLFPPDRTVRPNAEPDFVPIPTDLRQSRPALRMGVDPTLRPNPSPARIIPQGPGGGSPIRG